MENEVIMQNDSQAPAPEAPVKAKKSFNQKLMWDIIITILLAIGAVFMLIPFAWLILSVCKVDTELYTTIFPKVWSLKSFSVMWSNADVAMQTNAGFVIAFLNSILMTVPVVVVQIVVSAFAAYAFAKLKFVGKNIIFLVLLGTMMIPYAVIMLPQVSWYSTLGLTAVGPLAVIIPKFFGSIGTVFFLRAFFYGIPDSITEAARLDGAGYTKTFISVLLPLVMPAIATQAILSFIGNWNDYLGPMLLIDNVSWHPLPVLISRMTGEFNSDIQATLAASLISLIPILVVFAVFQKKIVGSIVFSAVKG